MTTKPDTERARELAEGLDEDDYPESANLLRALADEVERLEKENFGERQQRISARDVGQLHEKTTRPRCPHSQAQGDEINGNVTRTKT